MIFEGEDHSIFENLNFESNGIRWTGKKYSLGCLGVTVSGGIWPIQKTLQAPKNSSKRGYSMLPNIAFLKTLTMLNKPLINQLLLF